jgi:hypothetical protein
LEAWNELKATPDRDISYKTLESTDADFQGAKKKIEDEYGVSIKVEGFPHIVKIARGTVREYEGDRSKSDMLKWARS